ncbi:DNA-binding protein [Rhodococcus sp. NPDC058521]|uniref:DNA-binding protein n=1 Tax=Rhodococcus sp. NPDC058521 TaxID=3346536 RepID=UPI0036509696
MNQTELDKLGVATDLRTAARIMGLGVSTAYELARKNEFPVPVIRAGSRYIVPTAPLRALLGVGGAA